ncbi:hypothetical protein Tco_0382958 [Tanacetum coccineum]
MAGKCKADDLRVGSNMREGTATRVNLEESDATCDESPKVSNSSHLVSPTATINMPRGLYNVDVAATFRFPLTTSMDINTKSTSYAGVAGASAKDQPKVNSNFRPLVADPVFNGVNIFISRKVVEKEQLSETWAEKDYDEFQMLLFL